MIGMKRLLLVVSPLIIASGVLGEGAVSVEIDPTGARQLQASESDHESVLDHIVDPTARELQEELARYSARQLGKGKGKGKGGSHHNDDDDDSGDDDDDDDDGDDSSEKGGSKDPTATSAEDPAPAPSDPPVEEGKGKGKGGGSKSSKSSKKDTKSTKKTKSTKGSKSTKSGSSVAPGPAPGEPTAAPFNFEPTTTSPTSASSLTVRASPYALFYTLENDQTVPSQQDLAQVAEVTRGYLEEFMTEFYSMTSLTNLDDFLTFRIRHSFTVGQPVQIDYRSTGLFNPSTIFLPGQRQLDELIASAFMGEELEVYISRVQSLPDDNVFSTTEAVVQGVPDIPDPRANGNVKASGSNLFTAGLAATAAGIVVLAAGLVVLRRQPDSDDEFGEADDRKAEHATVAGETCNSSLDGSSASLWRRGSNSTRNFSGKYILDEDDDEDDLNEDEFEDEPLDGDSTSDNKDVSRPQSPVDSVAT